NSFAIDGQSGVGDYVLTVAGALGNANYELIGTTDGLWTVTPRPITVSANDTDKLLGTSDPALSWIVSSGSLGPLDTAGDVFSGALARDPGELPGAYAIGQGTLAANA